eukprot:TRINITY_DN1326_c0_g1_i1.p1 TRINITY_DN1326_c0_g1~~TRINITY_DN1326_c0_g1_i1.p1  ORF type:complete len:342 (+),score=55.04 TRINITY_DN1326_c0_g1_i1:228-1253(+)
MNSGLRDSNKINKQRKKNYYDILGVSCDIQFNELKRSYIDLIQRHHNLDPGRQRVDQELIKEIEEAYAILSDPDKRREYNTQLASSEKSSHRPLKRKRHLLAHIRTTIEVSIQESLIGCTKTIEFNRYSVCTKCRPKKRRSNSSDNLGENDEITKKRSSEQESNAELTPASNEANDADHDEDQEKKECPDCRGKVMIRSVHQVNIPVPTGVQNGMRCVLEGEGDTNTEGDTGDLIVIFKVAAHPLFQRIRNDAVFTIDLPFSSFLFGCSVCAPSLYHGDLWIDLVPFSLPGSMLLFPGHGFFDPLSKERGDLRLEFVCLSLSDKDLKFLQICNPQYFAKHT